jgi:hypothetical protein
MRKCQLPKVAGERVLPMLSEAVEEVVERVAEGLGHGLETSPDGHCCQLRAWVDSRSHRAAEGVPGQVVEPVKEVAHTVRRKVLGSAIVEVWIELVDDWTILPDGKEANIVGMPHRVGTYRRRAQPAQQPAGARAHSHHQTIPSSPFVKFGGAVLCKLEFCKMKREQWTREDWRS